MFVYIYFSMWFIIAVSIILINIYVIKFFKTIGKSEPEFFERNGGGYCFHNPILHFFNCFFEKIIFKKQNFIYEE